MERDKFFVGINVIIVRDNKILLGKRKNIFGEGEYGLPGGHLELSENMQQAATRELLEETGLVCNSFIFSNVANTPGTHGHYLQICFIAQDVEGEPKLMEPEKCYRWEWFLLSDLPKNIFRTHIPQIDAYLSNRNFTDSIIK